jgi:proteic killer suppression protein
MIKNFKHKGLSHFFVQNNKKHLNAKDVPKITRILDRLDTAVVVKDMNIPGWDLHELKGTRKGIWSVAVRQNWKITFRFENGEALDVNLRITTNEYQSKKS